MAEAICLLGATLLVVAILMTILYLIHVLSKRTRGQIAAWATSQALRDGTSGEFIMMPPHKLARSLAIFSTFTVVVAVYNIVTDLNEPEARGAFSQAMIVLVLAFCVLTVYAAVGMKLRNSFRFDKKGIREYRGSTMVGSIEWMNVDTVTASTPRFSLIIRWSGRTMTVPTSHEGLSDLLTTIKLAVPESRQIGIDRLAKRVAKAQSKLAGWGYRK